MSARIETVLSVVGVYALSAVCWGLLFAVGGWIPCVIMALVAAGGSIAFFSWIITGRPVPGEDE